MSLAVKEALYRIAQEAMQNAIRHAHPSRLGVSLVCESDSFTLEVSDDGVGFDPQDEHPGHLGLHSMHERALGIGGTLEIISAPGRGAQVRARIPIQAT
jgi:signal transduction histidine kinase